MCIFKVIFDFCFNLQGKSFYMLFDTDHINNSLLLWSRSRQSIKFINWDSRVLAIYGDWWANLLPGICIRFDYHWESYTNTCPYYTEYNFIDQIQTDDLERGADLFFEKRWFQSCQIDSLSHFCLYFHSIVWSTDCLSIQV